MLALLQADRGRRRHRIGDCCRQRQQAMEDRPLRRKTPVCENYVKVWLTALGHVPRNASITGPKRSPSAHRCDLRIGAGCGRSSSSRQIPAARIEADSLAITLNVEVALAIELA